MKANLEFDLDTPDDVIMHRLMLAGPRLHSTLAELDNWLRSEIKYGLNQPIPPQALRDKLHTFLEERELDLWSLQGMQV